MEIVFAIRSKPSAARALSASSRMPAGRPASPWFWWAINPASQVYVRSKTKTADELGIYNETITPPPRITTEELLAIVRRAQRAAPKSTAFWSSLPLPPQIDAQRILLAVAPEKDVDGFHPCNVGAARHRPPGPRACTPAGIIELLKRYQIPIAGKQAVVVGRSDIVGKPMALLLLHENATVTICHSRTRDLPARLPRPADILVAAIGRAAMITADYISPARW